MSFAKKILKARKDNEDMTLSQKEVNTLLDVVNQNDEKMNDKIILSRVQPKCDNCNYKKQNKQLNNAIKKAKEWIEELTKLKPAIRMLAFEDIKIELKK